ncbi:MAG: 1-acyl-sn-glycerol-3-phosphate acyltransferase [Candidatus Eisenbacteria bacterium]|nr:1-acyl-sn-glycerol-3-phosphate acyltransferase [Candidatus Eisenbacteria bacterium]
MPSRRPGDTVIPANTLNRILGGWFIGSFVRRDSVVEGVAFLHEAWERHRAGTQLVVICNHASYADSHIIEQLLLRVGFRDFAFSVHHMAGQKTYRTPWRRFFTFGVNTIKVIQSTATQDPGLKRRQALESFKAFKRVVATRPVLLFPEGTRTRTGRMGPTSPALANYLRGSLVLPMALQGTERMLGVGMRYPQAATIVLRIGRPFIAQPVPRADKGQEMAAYVQHIIDLLDPPYRPVSETGRCEGAGSTEFLPRARPQE